MLSASGVAPAVYVHNLSPVIFKITDAIALRWYGLSYLAAFVGGVLLLQVLAKRRLWVLPASAASDFIAAAAIFGVFIGGRVGYMLWYEPRQHGWGWLTEDPLRLFRVWDGGMASHGGILGLVVFTWFYARRKRVSWTGLGDGLCVVAPLGLMFGRLANFINGELYGRVAAGVPWAVKFPGALVDPSRVESARFDEAMAAVVEVEPRLATFEGSGFFEAVRRYQLDNPEITRVIEPFLEPRHPSQLYQALLEGLLLFGILWTVRNRWPGLPNGVLTGLFFVFYAVFRIIGEQFREPDSASSYVGWFTSGQFLSLFMIVIGVAFVVTALRGRTGGAVSVSGS